MKLTSLILNDIIYHALFVTNKEFLMERFKPVHENIFYHHSTIEFKPKNVDKFDLGNELTIKIIGRLTNDNVDVLLVDNSKSVNKYPHITLSTAKDIKPMQSNIELEENIDKLIYFNDLYIEVKEGLFLKNNKIIFDI